MVSARQQVLYRRPPSASRKVLSLIAVVILFLTIPILVYVAYKQTTSQSHAAPSTTLAFSQSQVQVSPRKTFSLDISLDPGKNTVFLTNLVIDYDASVIKPTANGILPNDSVFPTVVAGPTYNICTGNQCSMSISLSVGNPTQAIQHQVTIATVNFQSVGQGLTTITFDQQTKVFSIASTDQANENVLSTSTPATIYVGTGAFPSVSGSPSTSITPTVAQDTTPSVCHFEKPAVCPQVCIAGQPCPPPCNPVWVCPNPSPIPTPLPACLTRAHDSNSDIEEQLTEARQHVDAIEHEINLLVNNKRLSASDRLVIAKKTNQTLASADTTISNDETDLKPSPTPIQYSGSSVGIILSNFFTFFQNLFHHAPAKK